MKITASCLQTNKLRENEVWEAKLQCGDILQFTSCTKEEIVNEGLRCPIHPDKYPGFISPIFQEVISLRKVKLKLELR